jgi:hypothetical protein
MTLRRTVSLTLYAVGCLAGLAITVYGFLAWKDAGFRIGTYPVATDPSTRGHERGLFVIGFILFAYCLFALVSATRYVEPEEDADDNGTNI